jgi:hypothetical protein
MTLKQMFYTLVGIIALIGLLLLRQGCQHRQDQKIATTTLQPDQKAKIIVNSHKRTITQVTRTGTQVLNMPSHTFTVVEDNSGKLHIEVQQWGTELEPLAGFAFDGNARLDLGASLFYYKRFDLNGSFLFNVSKGASGPFIKPSISLSYNVYSNTSIFLGTNPLAFHEVEGGIFWRF